MIAIIVIVVWLICAGVGAAIGESKGRIVAGALLGLVFGVIGLVIIACLPLTLEKRIENAQDEEYIVREAQRRKSELERRKSEQGFGRDLSR